MANRGRQPEHSYQPEELDRFLIGPGSTTANTGPNASLHGSGTDLLDKARRNVRCENEEELQSIALTRRIVIAFVFIMIIGGVFFVVMPYYGMTLPIIMPILAFAAIAVGALLTAPPAPKKPKCKSDDGRAIGCCQGPRPLRSFRERD